MQINVYQGVGRPTPWLEVDREQVHADASASVGLLYNENALDRVS